MAARDWNWRQIRTDPLEIDGERRQDRFRTLNCEQPATQKARQVPRPFCGMKDCEDSIMAVICDYIMKRMVCLEWMDEYSAS